GVSLGRIRTATDEHVDVAAVDRGGVVAGEDYVLAEIGLSPWQAGDTHLARCPVPNRRVEACDLNASAPSEMRHILRRHLIGELEFDTGEAGTSCCGEAFA